MSELVISDGDQPSAGGRVRFAEISSRAYEHPADRTALVALRKLHGFDTAVKKFQGMFTDRVIRMEYLGTSVRTSERQFGRIHAMARDAAAVLDLERVPEVYVRQSPEVNALTIGMSAPFIVLNTGLVDMMSPDELRFVIGHQIGHVMSGHSLYRTIAVHLLALGSMAAQVPLGGIGVQVILAALGEWMRKSVLSCDRAGLLVTQHRDTCLRALMKLAGGAHLEEMNVEEFLLQAAEFAQVGDVRDTVARVMLARDHSHPLAVVRVAELNEWAHGPHCAAVLAGDYPLRADDRDASLPQEVRESGADYGRRLKQSSSPILTKGRVLSQRAAGSGKDDPPALEAPGQPTPAWLSPAEKPAGRGVGYDVTELGSHPRLLLASLPSRTVPNVDFSLIVRIASDASALPTATGAPMDRLHVGPGGVKVTIVVRTSATLTSDGSLQQMVLVPEHCDSEPVRFSFRTRVMGQQHVRVTAWAGGTFLAELALQVTVDDRGSHEDNGPIAAPLGEIVAEPGEVAMQVAFDGRHYSFQLLSDRTWFEPVFADHTASAPKLAVHRALETLDRIARGRTEYSPSNTRRWMREIGTGLWGQMVPKTIQDQFWELRRHMKSFTVASGDDPIPWEMLYPLSDSHDDGFLVERVPVLRRTYNQERSRRIGVQNANFIVPPRSPDNAFEEVDIINRIVNAGGAPRIITRLDEIMHLVDSGQMGLAHFSCHNTFDTHGSRIAMEGGPFVPPLLNTAATKQSLKGSSPLVFLNACSSANGIPEYSQMMGWASQFMSAGAGAFVGTLWPVRSASSARFAATFYESIIGGETLGQAALKARLDSGADPGDPTWLAYSIYGDPLARIAS